MKKAFPFFLTLFFCGCQELKPFNHSIPHNNKKLEQEFKNKLNNLYPTNFLLTQRLIIKTNNLENTLSSYLLIKNKNNITAMATMGIGGTLFKIDSSPNKDIISKNLTRWPKDILINGILRDIKLIYTQPFTEKYQLALQKHGTYSLMRDDKDKHCEIIFNNNTKNPTKLILSQNKCIIYEIHFSQYNTLKGHNHPIPTNIKITDHTKNYQVIINNYQIEVH